MATLVLGGAIVLSEILYRSTSVSAFLQPGNPILFIELFVILGVVAVFVAVACARMLLRGRKLMR